MSFDYTRRNELQSLVFGNLDVMTEVAAFFHHEEVLPLALCSKIFLAAIRRHIGYNIRSHAYFFTVSVQLAQWALLHLGCNIRTLCIQSAKRGCLDVIKWLWAVAKEGSIYIWVVIRNKLQYHIR